MALKKIEAYECEYCGGLFKSNKCYHELECKYDPKARSCTTCIFNYERVTAQGTNFTYCPRAQSLFEFPHDKYCPDYKQDTSAIE